MSEIETLVCPYCGGTEFADVDDGPDGYDDDIFYLSDKCQNPECGAKRDGWTGEWEE